MGLTEARGDKPPLPVAPLTSRIETTAQPSKPDAPPPDHSSPDAAPHGRRNSFQELFGGPVGSTEARGDKPPLPVAPLTSRIETTAQPAAATPDAPPPDHSSPDPVPSIPGTDMSVYSRIAKPLSLDPLMQALEQAGLVPDHFRFDQLESFEAVPGHPELSYINRQLLIRGPHGAKLFDLAWALRTPWVTAAELKIYKVA